MFTLININNHNMDHVDSNVNYRLTRSARDM